jgi:gliding motility-associated-like protein
MNYNWNFGDGSALSTQSNPLHVYAAAGSYNVNLSVVSNHGCSGDTTKVMSAFVEKPVADFSVNPNALCQGQENTFTDLSTPAGTISKWSWNFGDGTSPSATSNPRYRYSRPGTYPVSLVVTNTTGCVSDPVSKDVTVYLRPVVDAGKNFSVPTGSAIQFQATANDTTVLKFLWTPSTGLSSASVLRPTLVVTQNQVYKITATGDGGCTASDTLSVRVLNQVEVPNAFSPNGDGINDRWEIPNLTDYPGAKVEIYNRWGQLVYQSYGYNRPWDGTYKGQPLPLGAYYYVITLSNGFKPVTGSVTLIK